MITESEKQAFKNNLSLVTSNSSLVKLDVVNEEVMERRHLLVAKRNRKLKAFSYGLNDTMRPTAYSLKYILDDFDRINKVSSLTK